MKGYNQFMQSISGKIRCKSPVSKTYIILAGFLLLLNSCAVQPPLPIRVNLPTNPTLAQVLQTPDTFKDTKVRWGGVIHKIVNLKSDTELEIISRDLDEQARPKVEDKTYGRFLANIHGFVEPSIFAPGREITVVGTVRGTVNRPIDEYEYNYPVVDVDSYQLWDQRSTQQGYDYWYRYDPWYWGYPWYPWWYPYPY